MKLRKVDAGVWVKANYELPTVDKWYSTEYGNVWFSFGKFYTDATYQNELEVKQWHKILEDVYVLTEDELEKVISLFNPYLILQGNPDLPMAENIKQFIQSITQ